jgi:hypothetical protein
MTTYPDYSKCHKYLTCISAGTVIYCSEFCTVEEIIKNIQEEEKLLVDD